jgi:hypothetical protein
LGVGHAAVERAEKIGKLRAILDSFPALRDALSEALEATTQGRSVDATEAARRLNALDADGKPSDRFYSQIAPKIGHGADAQFSRFKLTTTASAAGAVVNSTFHCCHEPVDCGNVSDVASICSFVASVSTIRGGPPVTRSFVVNAKLSR